ncbi:unnamed protein product [Discosporangium mesarthrocarpum]
MYSGTSGFAAWSLVFFVLPVLGLGFVRKLVQRGATQEEVQKELILRHHQVQFGALVLDCMATMIHPFLGVPRSQAELGNGRDSCLEILNKVLFETDLVGDNYFYAGYLLGYYTEANCPRYLRKEHFDTLKANLKKGNLILYCGRIEEYILTLPKGSITVASLLDHLDWMEPKMINDELGLLVKRMDPVKGKIFWRSFGTDVASSTPSMIWLNPKPVDCFDDRVHCYFSTWIIHLKDTQHTMLERCYSWEGKTVLQEGKLLDRVSVVLRVT